MKTAYSLVGAVIFGAIVHGQAAKPAPPAAPAAKEITPHRKFGEREGERNPGQNPDLPLVER